MPSPSPAWVQDGFCPPLPNPSLPRAPPTASSLPAYMTRPAGGRTGFEPRQSDICGHAVYQKQGLLTIAVLPRFDQSFIHLPV